MMPYINPNYFNQPQYQSLYQMPSMQSVQPYQVTTPNQTSYNALGKVVDSLEMVKASEIPMNGQTYYFPKADGSMIYSKTWLSDGTTQIGSFSPNKALVNDEVSNLSSKAVESDIEGLAQAIGVLREQVDALIENTKPVKGRKVAQNESTANDKSDN